MTGDGLAQAGLGIRFVPLRLSAEPTLCAGSQAYLCGLHGLSLERIVEIVESLVG
jgi:hypothetical protein